MLNKNVMMKMSPKVSIIILNWNGWKDTIECLESLYKITYPNYNVVVVDNGSKDDSIENIKKYCEGKIKIESKFFKYNFMNKPIKFIEFSEEELRSNKKEGKKSYIPYNRELIMIKNEKNYGFAEGNNIGIRYALKILKPSYICTLNNDTIVDPYFLNELINVIENNNTIGSLQSILLRPNEKTIDSLGQKLERTGSAKDIKIGEKYINHIKSNLEIFGACAASAIYRADILKKIGLFDKHYFIIFEDVDLSWRIQLNGYSTFLVPRSIVYHKRGISDRKNNNQFFSNTIYFIFKNSLINLIKYYPRKYFFRSIILNILRIVIIIFFSIMKKSFLQVCKEYLESIKIRNVNIKNPRLKEIQKKWIIDKNH